MNDKVLKDTAVILGLLCSVILSIIAIVFAVNHMSIWVFFVAVSMMVLFSSMNRAGKL